MLYDPKWEVTAKPDVFSLDSLIAWLEKMPADAAYSLFPMHSCLLGQFAHAMGAIDLLEASFDLGATNKFADIAFADSLTFGAALTRARAAKARSPAS